MVRADLIGHMKNGLEYIKGEKKVIFENGVVMPIAEFETASKLNTLGNLLLEYKFHPDYCGYDYAYCKSTGVIRKKAVHKPAEPKPKIVTVDTTKDFVQPVIIKEAVASLQKTEETQEKHRFSVDTASIIIIIMIIVGILSAFMSAYHTALALQIMGRTPFMGWITGTVMILFSATAFTAARYFINNKGTARFFGALFGILGVIIVLYSMFSTLTVNYTNYTNVYKKEVSEATKNSSTVGAYNAKVDILKKRLEDYDESLQSLEKDAEYWKTMSWKRHDEIQEQIRDIRQKREDAENELIEVQMEVPEVEAKAEESVDNIYTFLSSLFNLDIDMLQFIVQSVPAMFFDIIAPFALSCVFYLRDKKEE